ncbi:MAG: DUF459 domain-containing protein [Verrucomicrobia bacterium]|nr:DUF459 domain-containing protein [Verrucomicrobiota bacterium]
MNRIQSVRRGALGMLLACGLTTAAADGPRRILILGDSMMRGPAHSFELEFSKREGVETRPFTSLGSGLARLDVVDWLGRIRQLVSTFNPDTAVMFIGANDLQPMRTNRGVIRPEDAGWEEEYARRVGEAMDLLGDGGGVRVYWLELPDMPNPEIQKSADIINPIFEREAAKREFATFYRTRPLLSRKVGTFSRYVHLPNGMPLKVRDTDGMHLNRNGSDLLARNLAATLWPMSSPAPE